MFKNILSPFLISMSSLVTCAAPFDINNDLDQNNSLINSLKRPERNNKTIKNNDRLNRSTTENDSDKQLRLAKLREVAKPKTANSELEGDDESKDLGEFSNKFTPPPHPEVLSKTSPSESPELESPINSVTFNTSSYENPQESYNQYANLYNQNRVGSLSSDHDLNRKLDTILYLLEEQQHEKTNYVTEELILYLFLGIFIIFVIDSFVKVGKYVR